jgi:hypothetical protein
MFQSDISPMLIAMAISAIAGSLFGDFAFHHFIWPIMKVMHEG